jgi:o-succinylbenzoate synthase
VKAASSLELRRVDLQVTPPQVNARGSWAQRSILCVELWQGGVVRGRGEASPLPDYSPDTLESCEHALRALKPARLDALDGECEVDVLIAAVAELISAALPAARFALETALLDRAARRIGQPLWQLLCEPGAVGASRAVPLCALLPSADATLALAQARRELAVGVRVFKLKIGPERLTSAQADTLTRLRAELGGEVQLRLDANQSLHPAQLAGTLAALEPYAIEFLEEPIALGSEPLPESPCPIALDESLQGVDEAELQRRIERTGARIVVLKPTALGGFGACRRLAARARAKGCDVVVSHALEGPLGWAACAHLALASGSSRAAGLWPLAHQSAALPRIERGQILPSTEPGLGGVE